MSFRAETEKSSSALKMSTSEQVEGIRGPEGIYYSKHYPNSYGSTGSLVLDTAETKTDIKSK